jgi:predicted RNA-binding Zn-ribbon protein involved in translation (DUF1610 family)
MAHENETLASCVKCGDKFWFPNDGAGQIVPCPHCGKDTVLRAAKPLKPEYNIGRILVTWIALIMAGAGVYFVVQGNNAPKRAEAWLKIVDEVNFKNAVEEAQREGKNQAQETHDEFERDLEASKKGQLYHSSLIPFEQRVSTQVKPFFDKLEDHLEHYHIENTYAANGALQSLTGWLMVVMGTVLLSLILLTKPN